MNIWEWLRHNEWLPLWIEGIALVAIFFWDRLDSKQAHQETLKQITIAQQQMSLALNTERAWLTGYLEWPVRSLQYFDKQTPQGIETTAVVDRLELMLRNDGRTPAWIESVYAHLWITGHQHQASPSIPAQFIRPVAPNETYNVDLSATCSGKPKADEFLELQIVINYRDIYEQRTFAVNYQIELSTVTLKRVSRI